MYLYCLSYPRGMLLYRCPVLLYCVCVLAQLAKRHVAVPWPSTSVLFTILPQLSGGVVLYYCPVLVHCVPVLPQLSRCMVLYCLPVLVHCVPLLPQLSRCMVLYCCPVLVYCVPILPQLSKRRGAVLQPSTSVLCTCTASAIQEVWCCTAAQY